MHLRRPFLVIVPTELIVILIKSRYYLAHSWTLMNWVTNNKKKFQIKNTIETQISLLQKYLEISSFVDNKQTNSLEFALLIYFLESCLFAYLWSQRWSFSLISRCHAISWCVAILMINAQTTNCVIFHRRIFHHFSHLTNKDADDDDGESREFRSQLFPLEYVYMYPHNDKERVRKFNFH